MRRWYSTSGLPLKSFFNTSGKVYKSLNLKDKPSMSEEEQLALLVTDGMLVKRPITVDENPNGIIFVQEDGTELFECAVQVGFNENTWLERLDQAYSLQSVKLDTELSGLP